MTSAPDLQAILADAIAAIGSFVDRLGCAPPSTTEVIDMLGVTEVDIRSVTATRDGWEVRLWNHLRLSFTVADLRQFRQRGADR